MATSKDGRERDDFERRWEALTEQLGDLQPAPEDPASRGRTARGRSGRTPTGRADAGQARGEEGEAGWGEQEASGPPADDAPLDELSLRTGSGPRDYDAPDVEEHFVPPDPPLSTPRNPWVAAGWIVLVASIVLLLASAVLSAHMPTWVGWVAAVLLLVSAVFLVSRLPRRRSGDPTDPDDGAQV